jgi:hypothetical protein
VRVAFHIRNCVGTRDDWSFAVQWLAYALPCRRFAGALAGACARLGADAGRYSFTVRDFHPLLLAGLPAHSENIPKSMIPVGDKPILWHLMHYYSQFGHKDFVLCLGYKANVIKEYFLNYKPQTYADCVVSGLGNEAEILGDPQQDWRIAMIDTGIWRNIGQRLWAVREIR